MVIIKRLLPEIYIWLVMFSVSTYNALLSPSTLFIFIHMVHIESR